MSLVTPADLTESGDYHAAAFELPAACDFSVFQDSFGASRTLVARPSLVDCDPAPGTPLLISWCTDAFSRFTVWECAMLGYGSNNMCDHQRRGARTAASNCEGSQPATEACGTSGHRAGFGRSGTSAAGPRRQSTTVWRWQQRFAEARVPPSALGLSFHSDFGLLAQRGRKLLLQDDPPTYPSQCLLLNRRSPGRHQRLPGRAQCQPKPFVWTPSLYSLPRA